MAATGTPTPNIGLRRAQGTDPASVDDINYNSALIDTKLGAVGNSSVQDQIDTLNSNLENKISGATRLYGFENRRFVQVVSLSSANFYGVAKVITKDGEKTVLLKGYDNTQTDSSGIIKTYKHNENGDLDIQFVFPDSFEHGVLILGGSVTNGVIISQ